MQDQRLRVFITGIIGGLLIYWGVTNKFQRDFLPVVMLVLSSIFFKGQKEESGKTKKSRRKRKQVRPKKTDGVAEPPTIHPPGDHMVRNFGY
jgi:hypothetical protein